MDERDLIEVDTKGLCLLCLKPYSSSTHKMSSETAVGSSLAFKTLLRHLNVNTPELFNCSPLLFQSMNLKENINLQVSLCAWCSSVTTKFDGLHKNFEVIRLQMDNCLHSVASSMMDGDQSEERVREYRKRMQPVKKGDILNYSIVTNLRQETVKKCCSRINTSIPRVFVAKIGINPKPPDLRNQDGTTQTEICMNGTDELVVEEEGIVKTEILVENVDESEDVQMAIEIQNCYSLATPEPPSTSKPILSIPIFQAMKIGNETNCNHCAAKFTLPDHLYTHLFSQHIDNLLAEDLPPNTSIHACQFALNGIVASMLQTQATSKPMFDCEYCHTMYSERNKIKFIIHLFTTHPSLMIPKLITKLTTKSADVDPGPVDNAVDALPPIPPLILVKQPYPRRTSNRKKYAIKQLTKLPKFETKQCHICNKHCPSTLHLNKHLGLHYKLPAKANVLPNQCRYCNLIFAKTSSLNFHILEIHPQNVMHRLFPPNTPVDKCFSVVEDILKEIKQWGNRCVYCGKIWESKSRKRHITRAHFYTEFMNDVKSRMETTGDVISATDQTVQNAQVPLTMLNKLKSGPLKSISKLKSKCNKCHAFFITKSKAQFDKHLLQCRGQKKKKKINQKINKCEYCSKTLGTKGNLRRHVLENHLSEEVMKELSLNPDVNWKEYINLITTTLIKDLRLSWGCHCPYCRVDVKFINKRHLVMLHFDEVLIEIQKKLETDGHKVTGTGSKNGIVESIEESCIEAEPHGVFIKSEV